jgi:hypothetical protein
VKIRLEWVAALLLVGLLLAGAAGFLLGQSSMMAKVEQTVWEKKDLSVRLDVCSREVAMWREFFTKGEKK